MRSAQSLLPPLDQVVFPTTVIEAPRLSDRLGVKITIATETFQRGGSFKFRAAYNVALNTTQNLIIAASSGNFGQAVAMACSMVGKACIVVMPANSAQVKIDGVREYGGRVELIDVSLKSRAERVTELAGEFPDAYVASGYDDPLVIQGNASLGVELCRVGREIDLIIAPIGGGGLTSGLITGVRQQGKNISVFAAEPLMANDAARSIRAGRIIANEAEPQTIADGTRTLSIGKLNWEILQKGLAGIVEVPEENIKGALRLLFSLANLKVEPTGALGIGAVMTQPELFRGRSVCCVVSGGNVDLETYRSLLAD